MLRLSRPLRAPFLVLCGIVLVATPPAAAQVVPLEPTVDLAEPGQANGYTAPGLALRPDGGSVAAWTNVSTDQVVGSPFEPPAGGPVDLDLFELGPEDDTRFAPTVTRGPDGAYLAVWPTGLSTEQTGLVARAFDGDGAPLGARQGVHGEAVGSFAVALCLRSRLLAAFDGLPAAGLPSASGSSGPAVGRSASSPWSPSWRTPSTPGRRRSGWPAPPTATSSSRGLGPPSRSRSSLPAPWPRGSTARGSRRVTPWSWWTRPYRTAASWSTTWQRPGPELS